MGFQNRAKRWPAAWQLIMRYGPQGDERMMAEIRSVSASGCTYVGPISLPLATPIQFSVCGEDVHGHVVRRMRKGGAIAFGQLLHRRQLENLRQVRSLNTAPTPEQDSTPSDDELRRVISTIL